MKSQILLLCFCITLVLASCHSSDEPSSEISNPAFVGHWKAKSVTLDGTQRNEFLGFQLIIDTDNLSYEGNYQMNDLPSDAGNPLIEMATGQWSTDQNLTTSNFMLEDLQVDFSLEDELLHLKFELAPIQEPCIPSDSVPCVLEFFSYQWHLTMVKE